MRKTIILLITFLALLALTIAGCVASDPIIDNIYIRGDLYTWNGTAYQIVNTSLAGGGGGELDPIFTASDAFPITAAWVAAWNAHPALTTGTHGITGTIVGTSDAQALTNKQLTMNNNVPIYWKDTLGNSKEVFNLWLDNNLAVLEGETADIYCWLGSGTNQRMILWGSGSTAVSQVKDSPMIKFVSYYWDTLNKAWEATIIHNMITAGATPKSRLEFEVQGEDILRLENDTGVVKAYFDGNLDMTTHQINNVVDPTLDQDAATKKYVDDLSVNFAGMYKHESAVVTTIQQVNDWHMVNGFTTGYLGGGWTFHAGEQIAITAFDDNGDGKTRITCVGHTTIAGDAISISNTTNYDGVWTVEQVLVNTFVINTPWVADEGAKFAEHGSCWHSATATSAGKYLVTYSLSVFPGSANCNIEASLYYNATQDIKSESQTKLSAITDCQNIVGFSIMDLATGDVVSLAVRNITDGGDFIIRNGNMTLVKIGGP